jgi:hypothetical protein
VAQASSLATQQLLSLQGSKNSTWVDGRCAPDGEGQASESYMSDVPRIHGEAAEQVG